MGSSRRLGVGLVLVALAVVLGAAAWQLTRTPRVALGPLSIDAPASCDRAIHESGDAGSAALILYLPGPGNDPCLGLQERAASIDDLVAQLVEAAGADATVEPGYTTACGLATRVKDGGTTTYLLRRGDSSWIISFDVPEDTIATCAMAS